MRRPIKRTSELIGKVIRVRDRLAPDDALTELVFLVDDYLAKHEATLAAHLDRELILNSAATIQASKDAATNKLITTHNERASAFRALRLAVRP